MADDDWFDNPEHEPDPEDASDAPADRARNALAAMLDHTRTGERLWAPIEGAGGLDPADLRLLATLKLRRELAVPSLETLAYRLGVDESTVDHALRRLKDRGLLTSADRDIYGIDDARRTPRTISITGNLVLNALAARGQQELDEYRRRHDQDGR